MPATLSQAPRPVSYGDCPIWIEIKSGQYDYDDPDGPSQNPFTPNLKAYIQICQVVDGEEVPLGEKCANYDPATGCAQFDISAYMCWQPALPSEASIVQNIQIQTTTNDAKITYRIKYADKFGEPPEPDEVTTSDDYIALVGASGRGEDSEVPSVGVLPLHTMIDACKKVTPDQPDYVYLCTRQNTLIDICIDYTLEDMSTGQFVLSGALLSAGNVNAYNSGHDQLNLAAQAPGQKIIAYQYTIKNQADGSILFMRKYIVDHCQPWNHILLYQNACGGYETVGMCGKLRESYQTDSETFQRYRSQDFNLQDGTFDQLDCGGWFVYDLDSGYHELEYVKSLRQLLHARIWLVDVAERKFKKLIRTSSSVDPIEDGQKLYSMRLQARAAWDEKGYC